jgi:SprT protein
MAQWSGPQTTGPAHRSRKAPDDDMSRRPLAPTPVGPPHLEARLPAHGARTAANPNADRPRNSHARAAEHLRMTKPRILRSNAHQASPEIRRLLARWGRAWRVAGLSTEVRVEFSARLTRSLGRCHPRSGIIRLHPAMQTEKHRDIRHQVLCHEAAHIATYRLYGARAKPHGPEWRGLVESSGFTPSVVIALDWLGAARSKSKRPREIFEYQCPVCQAAYSVRRRDSRLRCRPCTDAGLLGHLNLIHIPQEGPE